MSIVLTAGATTVTLHSDLQWKDEFEWGAVEQKTTYSTTGALIRQATEKQAGRPITLVASEDKAWMTRTTLSACYLLTQSASLVMSLNLRGVVYDVVWNHSDGPIDFEPVVPFSDPLGDDFYIATLRFLTV